MVLNSKIEDEVQSGEEDDDYLIGANDNCLEKPTLTAIRSELKESWTPDLFTVSEEMQGWTIKMRGMVENEKAKNTKQASVQILASENFKRNLIDDQQSKIYEVFFIPSPIFFL